MKVQRVKGATQVFRRGFCTTSVSTKLSTQFSGLNKVTVEQWSSDQPSAIQVSMNDPKKRNALGSEMIAELRRVIADKDFWQSDERFRVIILGGNGPVFSAGHDLKEVAKLTEEGAPGLGGLLEQCSLLMHSIRECPLPIIAVSQGHAAAAGLQLHSACDLAVTMQGTLFSTPGINVGLFCSTPAVEIGRVVSNQRQLMDMLLTGEPIASDRAYEIGLVNYVAKDEEDLQRWLNEKVQSICKQSKAALSVGKQGFYHQMGCADYSSAHDSAAQTMLDNARLDDLSEGLSSFIGKRKPDWKHR